MHKAVDKHIHRGIHNNIRTSPHPPFRTCTLVYTLAPVRMSTQYYTYSYPYPYPNPDTDTDRNTDTHIQRNTQIHMHVHRHFTSSFADTSLHPLARGTRQRRVRRRRRRRQCRAGAVPRAPSHAESAPTKTPQQRACVCRACATDLPANEGLLFFRFRFRACFRFHLCFRLCFRRECVRACRGLCMRCLQAGRERRGANRALSV